MKAMINDRTEDGNKRLGKSKQKESNVEVHKNHEDNIRKPHILPGNVNPKGINLK